MTSNRDPQPDDLNALTEIIRGRPAGPDECSSSNRPRARSLLRLYSESHERTDHKSYSAASSVSTEKSLDFWPS
jgi:hypothetical protein